MHETSLGQVVRDYLTGEDIEETSYEEFRQAMARMLVEELGYPPQRLLAKVGIEFPVDGETYCRVADLVACDEDGSPLFLLFFVAGQPGSFDREVLAAARLYPGGPIPLVAVTDTREAVLLDAATGTTLGTSMRAIPRYEDLPALAKAHPAPRCSPQQLDRERRILYAYSEFIYGSCCHTCTPKPAHTPGRDDDSA